MKWAVAFSVAALPLATLACVSTDAVGQTPQDGGGAALILEDPPEAPEVLGADSPEEATAMGLAVVPEDADETTFEAHPDRSAVAPGLVAEDPVDLGEDCIAQTRLEAKSPLMQKALERRLRRHGWMKRVTNESFAVAVVDLSEEGRHWYAGVNDDEMIYAASMPKIAILLSVIEAVNRGDLLWTPRLEHRLRQMIVRSSNRFASSSFRLVGLDGVEQTMRDPRYCFYDDTHGGLWVGRAYGGGGPTRRDPLRHISHGATARQTARFYTMLFRGELVTPDWSDRMYDLMSPPAHHHKFVGGLKDRPGAEVMARKSGTWRRFHSDSVLISHRDRMYVAVGVSKMKRGGKVLRKLIKEIDDMVMKGDYRDGKLAAR